MIKYFKNIFEAIYSSVIGLGVTFKHLFHRAVTVQYPDQRLPVSDGYKGKHKLFLDKCVSCLLCAKACPPQCITIETEKGEDKKSKLKKFTINYNNCLFCGFCVESCNKASLVMTKEYELSYTQKSDLVLDLMAEGVYSERS